MTREEKIIATAFTGTMFIDGSDMGLLYEYMEKKVGHGVIDIMLADKAFWEELHRACEQDFIDMVSKEQPSLPSNLDKAAEKYGKPYHDRTAVTKAFKAGAEWMAGQGVKARCLESSNPVSESPDERRHLVTLLYEENENTPYVVCGDEVEIVIRKKQ